LDLFIKKPAPSKEDKIKFGNFLNLLLTEILPRGDTNKRDNAFLDLLIDKPDLIRLINENALSVLLGLFARRNIEHNSANKHKLETFLDSLIDKVLCSKPGGCTIKDLSDLLIDKPSLLWLIDTSRLENLLNFLIGKHTSSRGADEVEENFTNLLINEISSRNSSHNDMMDLGLFSSLGATGGNKSNLFGNSFAKSPKNSHNDAVDLDLFSLLEAIGGNKSNLFSNPLAEAEEKFAESVTGKGRVLKEVPGDGRCLFHAILSQILVEFFDIDVTVGASQDLRDKVQILRKYVIIRGINMLIENAIKNIDNFDEIAAGQVACDIVDMLKNPSEFYGNTAAIKILSDLFDRPILTLGDAANKEKESHPTFTIFIPGYPLINCIRKTDDGSGTILERKIGHELTKASDAKETATDRLKNAIKAINEYYKWEGDNKISCESTIGDVLQKMSDDDRTVCFLERRNKLCGGKVDTVEVNHFSALRRADMKLDGLISFESLTGLAEFAGEGYDAAPKLQSKKKRAGHDDRSSYLMSLAELIRPKNGGATPWRYQEGEASAESSKENVAGETADNEADSKGAPDQIYAGEDWLKSVIESKVKEKFTDDTSRNKKGYEIRKEIILTAVHEAIIRYAREEDGDDGGQLLRDIEQMLTNPMSFLANQTAVRILADISGYPVLNIDSCTNMKTKKPVSAFSLYVPARKIIGTQKNSKKQSTSKRKNDEVQPAFKIGPCFFAEGVTVGERMTPNQIEQINSVYGWKGANAVRDNTEITNLLGKGESLLGKIINDADTIFTLSEMDLATMDLAPMDLAPTEQEENSSADGASITERHDQNNTGEHSSMDKKSSDGVLANASKKRK
jgi:hypothetical protein